MKGNIAIGNPRIIVFFAGLVGLAGAIYLGRAIGNGDHEKIYLAFVTLVAGTLTLGMGSRYWLICPLGMTITLPFIPLAFRSLELSEVCSAFVFGMFVVMVLLRRNFFFPARLENVGIFLFMALIAAVYLANPVGILIMGSDKVGGRFYLQVVLAFCAYLVLSSQSITDKDARWVIRFYFFGSLISLGWGLFSYFVLGQNEGASEDGFYTWHQILAGPPFVIVIWLFSKYKPSEILGFKRPLLLLVYIAAILLTFTSGKRAMVASILLIPILSSILNRQFRFAYLGAALFLLLCAVVTIGQGTVFSLPLPAQRALMYLPANWDTDIASMKAGGSMDEFRKQMRILAWEKAKEHPWLGEGYAIDMSDTGGFGSLTMLQDPTTLLSVGRSWHSLWLGMAADLGVLSIPIYILVYLTAIITAFWILKNSTPGGPIHTLAFMILMITIVNISKSYTTGHSAKTPFGEFWTFGLLVAMKYSLLATRRTALRTTKPELASLPDAISTAPRFHPQPR